MKKKQVLTFTEWIDKAIEYLIYASVVIIPLIFLPYLNSVFTTPKLYVFRVITLIIVLLWTAKFIIKKEVSIRKTSFFWFLLAYAVISVITTVFSVNFWSSLIGTYGRFIGLITVLNLLFWVYIVISEMLTKERIWKLMWASVLTAFLVTIYGLLQHFDLWVNVFSWSQDPSERMFSTIGHSNHVAAYLGMNLMLLIGICSTSEFSWSKVALNALGILFFVAIVLTASRGGIVAVVIALIIWLVFVLRAKGLKKFVKTYGKVFLFMFALLFLAGVVFRSPLSNLKIVERTTSTIEFIQQGNIPDRVSWWVSTFEMIKDKPFIGHGLSTYRDVYNKYRRTDYKLPDDAQDHITPESAHNEYLNSWAQQGTIGFIIYLLMVGAVFYYAIRYLKEKYKIKDKLIVFSLLTALIVYLIQVFISFGVVTTLFLFYTIIGLLIAYIELEKKKKFIEFNLHIIFRIFISIIVLVSVGLGFIYSLKFLAANYYFKQGETLASKNDFEQSTDRYEKAISCMSYISEYFEGYADYIFEIGIKMPENSQESYLLDAIKLYDRAIEINPNLPYVHVNKGLAASRIADLNKDNEEFNNYVTIALGEHETAVELSRNNPVYPYKYGKQLIYFEEIGKGVDQLLKVLEIRSPYKDTKEIITQYAADVGLTEETLQTL